jgi:hypothetical protein
MSKTPTTSSGLQMHSYRLLCLLGSGLVLINAGIGLIFGYGSAQILICIVALSILWLAYVTMLQSSQQMYWCSLLPIIFLLGIWFFFVPRKAVLLDWLFLTPVLSFLSIVVFSIKRAAAQPQIAKKLFYANICLLFSISFMLFLLELISSFIVPTWPARDLRPARVAKKWAELGYNSWGTRDVERSVEKPKGIKRAIFIGDSFLEGVFTGQTLSQASGQVLKRFNRQNWECINLGISATGPIHYLYRLRNVGLKLSPDLVLLFVYSGNDFSEIPYEDRTFEILDERPLPSLIGNILPAFSWFLVDRFSLSAVHAKSASVEGEFELLQRISTMPRKEGIVELSTYMHQYYLPKVPAAKIEEILNRGGDRFWRELAPREKDREYLTGWRLKLLIEYALKHNGPDANSRKMKPQWNRVRATASYIQEMSSDLKRRHVPFRVFLIPVGENVDPEYAEFWDSWYGKCPDCLQSDLNRRALNVWLKTEGIMVFDLDTRLSDVPGTFRKFDGHWTEKGQTLVADAVVQTFQ